MAEFKVGDKVRINEERIKGKWLEKFKRRHPRKDGIHEVTAKMGMYLLLDEDDYGREFPALFIDSWLRKARKREPKFKVGDMVRVLNGQCIKKYTKGWCMEKHIGYIFEIGRIEDFEDGRFGYRPNGDCLTYDERGLELVKGVTKDPSRVYITDKTPHQREGETIPKAKIQKLLDNIGEMIAAYRKDDEDDKADGMEIVVFALRLALELGEDGKNKTGVR